MLWQQTKGFPRSHRGLSSVDKHVAGGLQDSLGMVRTPVTHAPLLRAVSLCQGLPSLGFRSFLFRLEVLTPGRTGV